MPLSFQYYILLHSKTIHTLIKYCNNFILRSSNVIVHFVNVCVIGFFLAEEWVSLLHHVQDEHQWLGGECEHTPLTNPLTNCNGNAILHLKRGDKHFQALSKIVRDKRWLESMKFYTKFRYVL